MVKSTGACASTLATVLASSTHPVGKIAHRADLGILSLDIGVKLIQVHRDLYDRRLIDIHLALQIREDALNVSRTVTSCHDGITSKSLGIGVEGPPTMGRPSSLVG
jgi:hypothetical protein